METVAYCRVCDDEFRPEIIVCSDCGGALIVQEEGLGARGAVVFEGDGQAPRAGDWRTALDRLPISTLLPVRAFDSLTDLEPAVAAFADAEIPSRVLVQNGRYILLIGPDSLAEAQVALQAGVIDEEEAPDPTFDAATGRYSSCPACAAQLGDEFTGLCPECGLELSARGAGVSVPEAD